MESATTTSSKTVTRGASRRHPPMQAIKVVVDASAGGSSARATPRDRVEIRTMSRSSTSVGKSEEGSRVPVVRVVGIFWNQECSDLCASGFEWPEGVRKLWFGFPDVPLEDVPLPESLKELIFVDTNFSTNEDKVVCPERLKPLVFNWKRPHVTLYDSHGALPPSRSEKTGDAHFTAPTSDDKSALWPQSRREFSPRVYFIQPLLNIKWPRGLEKIEWSREFIPPVEMIPWPDGLRQLVFGWNFNQSLIHVQWPDSLESIAFKFGFSQPLAHPTTGQSLLPRGLRKLKLGFCRKGMLTHSALPEGLRELVCSTIQVELSTVRWPSGLTDVCFDCVRSGGIFGGFPTLPPNLERLRVGNCFGGSGGRRSFPATMKELTVRACDHDAIFIDRLPDGMEKLQLPFVGRGYIIGSHLPQRLKHLTLVCKDSYSTKVPEVDLPDGLEELHFKFDCSEQIDVTGLPTPPRGLKVLGFRTERCKLPPLWFQLPDALERLYLPPAYPISYLTGRGWPRHMRTIKIGSRTIRFRQGCVGYVPPELTCE